MNPFATLRFDDRDFLLPGYFDHEQPSRPHLFVNKLRERPGSQAVLGRLDRPSRNLGVDEFASAYAAAEFAAHFNLYLDTHVTIDFGRLGITEPDEVQAALSQFTRCYAAWCGERLIPPAWIASVEMSRSYDYHAHVALFVPGDLEGLSITTRREFRVWAKGYTTRRGEHVPRAIRVRGGRKTSLLTHWVIFSYLLKGFDRTAVLCSARNSPDGRPIMLGDIIARYYRDPGPVALNRRISVSNSLGPKRREFGAPTGCDFMLPHGPNWSLLDIDGSKPLTLQDELNRRWQVPIPTPFRSTFDDGIYDVRRLYPPCFYEHVTKLSATVIEEVSATDVTVPALPSLTEQLLQLEY